MDLATLHIKTRLVFGENSIEQIGELASECGGHRVLIVTDHGVAEAGHAERATASIEAAGMQVTVFKDLHENPTTLDVDACVEVARQADIDLLVGLGGGSSIDTARGANFLLTNGGTMQDYWGIGKASMPMLPMIAIPTTTGTGSEMQSFALIAHAETHQKMACGDKKAAAKVALLDPTLSATQPCEVIAHTGMDCLAHALETAVTRKRTPFSQIFSTEACRLALSHFDRILVDPADLSSQGQMLLASACAGIAIEHSMLGAAHAMANPLTAQFGIVHGEAVGVMLPHVMEFNSACDSALAGYARLACACGLASPDTPPDRAYAALRSRLQSVSDRAGMTFSLKDRGVTPEAVESLAENAARQWTGQFNPRTVSLEDFQAMYRAAL